MLTDPLLKFCYWATLPLVLMFSIHLSRLSLVLWISIILRYSLNCWACLLFLFVLIKSSSYLWSSNWNFFFFFMSRSFFISCSLFWWISNELK